MYNAFIDPPFLVTLLRSETFLGLISLGGQKAKASRLWDWVFESYTEKWLLELLQCRISSALFNRWVCLDSLSHCGLKPCHRYLMRFHSVQPPCGLTAAPTSWETYTSFAGQLMRSVRSKRAAGCHRKFMFLLVGMLRFTFTHSGFLAHLHCVTSECWTGSSQVCMPSVIYRHLCWLKKQLPYGLTRWEV